jgi:hypothetical protein
MKKTYFIFLALMLLLIWVGCNNSTDNKTKTTEIIQIETKDTLIPKIFLDFYYDMDHYAFNSMREQVKKDHPENFDNNGNFLLQTKSIDLKFMLDPLIIGDKLKTMSLWLIGEKKKLDLKNGPKKEVVIFTGKMKNVSVNKMNLKVQDKKVLTSEISHINLPYAKELMGNRHGMVPGFEEFTSWLSTIEPKTYWDCDGYTYFEKGNLICSELIKLFSDKYNSPIKKDSTYFSYYMSGYRLKDIDAPRNPNYGDIFEIRFKHNIKTLDSKYTWQLPDRVITINVTKGLIDKQTTESSNTGIITDIKIIYSPKKYPEINDSERIKKNKTDSLRIQKSKEII